MPAPLQLVMPTAPISRYPIRMAVDHRIPFAIGPDGRVMSIQEVPRGLECKCTCPACEAKLVAKKGPKQAHHFAHRKDANCAHALESSIHLAVKTIIEREMAMQVPACVVMRKPDDSPPPMHRYDVPTIPPYYYAEKLHDEWAVREVAGVAGTSAKRQRFDAVLVERQQGDIRPDLIAIQGDRKLYVEVAVTHFVDNEKLAKIRARGVATIEIRVPYDTKSVLDWSALRRLVIKEATGKAWLYHPVLEERAEQHYISLTPEREQARRRAAQARLRAEARARQLTERKRLREEQRQAWWRARMAAQQEEEARLQKEARAAHDAREAMRSDPAVLHQMAEAEAARAASVQRLIAEASARSVAERQARQAALDVELREQREQEQRVREEQEAEKRTEHDALIARLRHGVPSAEQPIDPRAIFLDADLVSIPASVAALRVALGDTPCSIVLTSHNPELAQLASHLAPLGGRYLGTTKSLNISDPALRRTREIVTWLDEHPSPVPLVLSPVKIGTWPGWKLHVVRTSMLTAADLTVLRQWLRES